MVALAEAEGDAARAERQPDGSILVTRDGIALLRGLDAPAMRAAWEALLHGALAAWDRFARLKAAGPNAWRIVPG
jgi:hypothetical protein